MPAFYALPFIVGGDWVVGPDVLAASALAERPDARTIATSEGACKGPATGKCSTIDYWLASDSLVGAMADLGIAGGFPPRVHYPIQVSVGPTDRAQQVRRQ
eukprot:2163473-Pyramimonas_sp.AAC.1